MNAPPRHTHPTHKHPAHAPPTRAQTRWLHGWLGFVVGFFTLCIFVTGTLAVFNREITTWMQPEIPPDAPAFNARALDAVRPAIIMLQKSGENPVLDLPSPRSAYLRLIHFDGHEFIEQCFDPGTGAPHPARETAGGTFLFDLHANMRSGPMGVKAIMLAALGMLLILVSGVALHLRQMVGSLLVLRPFAPRLSAWRDVHLLAAVPILPFLFFMTWSGGVIHGRNILPPSAYFGTTPPIAPKTTPGPVALPRPKNRRPPRHDDPPSIPSLPPLLHAAEAMMGAGQAGRILFSDDTIFIAHKDSAGPFLTSDHVDFSRADSHPLRFVHDSGTITGANQLLRGLHFARWADTTVRWIYFLGGLSGCVMMGSGLVLFLIRRRPTHHRLLSFRLAEGLTIATTLCLPLAFLSFLWANRIIPAQMPGRALLEAHVFGTVWGTGSALALICCIAGNARPAWRLSLGTIVLAGVFLPALDAVTRPGLSLWHRPTAFAAIDLLAVLAGLAAWKGLRRT